MTTQHLTAWRLTSACLDGTNIDHVIKPLVEQGDHVRTIVRAARVCETRTPLAYYDSLEWAL